MPFASPPPLHPCSSWLAQWPLDLSTSKKVLTTSECWNAHRCDVLCRASEAINRHSTTDGLWILWWSNRVQDLSYPRPQRHTTDVLTHGLLHSSSLSWLLSLPLCVTFLAVFHRTYCVLPISRFPHRCVTGCAVPDV